MKLLVISAAFPPMQAGEADHVYHICENLAQRGFDVHVITTQRTGILSGSRFEVRPVIRDWSWRDLWRLRQEVRRISPDAMLLYYIGWIYNYHPMITFMPTLAKRMDPTVRFVTQFANAQGADPSQFSIWARVLRKGFAWWATVAGVDYSFGTLLRDSDSLIVLSRIHGDWLSECFGAANQKTVLIPPPPIMKMCQDDATVARERGRKGLHLAPEEFVFAYLGYVYPGKGVETLLHAFQKVSQKYSNARLLILGGTIAREFPDRPGYVKEILELPKKLAIDEKVIWLGQYDWDSDQASTCLRSVDACVIPVDGGVQLNNSSFAAAVAHALPVIATRGTVLEDAFLDRENVLLCLPKNAEGLAHTMETLISNPDLARRLRKGSLEMAAEWFSWTKAMDRTISVLGSTGSLPS